MKECPTLQHNELESDHEQLPLTNKWVIEKMLSNRLSEEVNE
jgi:hypothetical protein